VREEWTSAGSVPLDDIENAL